MKLSTLRKRAQRATKARGHAMRWQSPFGRADGPQSQYAVCKHCARDVLIVEAPAPNGIDIGGPAVALNCEGALQ